MNTNKLMMEMISYYHGDAKRIQHFIKVYDFALYIGRAEKLEPCMLEILETAALVHDIGIKKAEEKYGSAGGKYQEMEGPEVAEKMLLKLGYPLELIERVAYLVGHHHTYREINGLDYQILVEADFLVNMYEEQMDVNTIKAVRNRIFKTSTGIWLCDTMFLER